MHLSSDAMANIVSHYPDTVREGNGLNSSTDVAETIPISSHLNACPQCLLGNIQQIPHLVGNLSDRNRECCVTVPPLVDGTGINGDNVTFREHMGTRDPMNDH